MSAKTKTCESEMPVRHDEACFECFGLVARSLDGTTFELVARKMRISGHGDVR